MEKLFVIVRADLAPGAQLAQSCHAVCAFESAHRELYRAWNEGSNNLVALQVPDERALLVLMERAARDGIQYARFREPDFGGSITAIAVAGSGARLVSSLPLALRAPRVAA